MWASLSGGGPTRPVAGSYRGRHAGGRGETGPREGRWPAHGEDDEMADRTLSQDERKAIFLALVEAQDGGMDAARSREVIAERFAISQQQVKRIEAEGIDAEWPPL